MLTSRHWSYFRNVLQSSDFDYDNNTFHSNVAFNSVKVNVKQT